MLDLTLDLAFDLMLSVLSIEMLSPLSNVVGVIEMDGFMINGRFYCKELGALRVGDAAARSFLFDIGVRWDDLMPKDRRTCRYVTRFIHKLPFGVPRGVEAFEISAPEGIVLEFYQRVRQNESSVIGYKGGHYERDLLAILGVPSVNLESFGCPKAEGLIERLVWLETCGNHTTADAYLHCPKVEVESFEHWMQDTLLRQ